MKKPLLLAVAAVSLLGAAPPPFACDRAALSPERKRHFDELGPLLRTLVRQIRELSDGYEFQFPDDTASLQRIAEWTLGEHRCCPFFDIDLRLDREGGASWIRLTGRRGTKEFIRAGFKPWFPQ